MYTKTVVLTDDEVWPLLNILNEICHGISVKNFEQTIGVNKNVVIFLMDRISQHKNKTSYLTLNEKELNIIEKKELDLIKSNYVNKKYEIIAEATNRKKSIPSHFHVHLLVLRND